MTRSGFPLGNVDAKPHRLQQRNRRERLGQHCARTTDAKLLIGGLFTSFNGSSRPYVARLNRDGSLDGGFNPGTGPNNALVGLALQSDGKPIIGGFFTAVGGQSFRYLRVCKPTARLNSDSSLDPGSNPSPGADSTVNVILAPARWKNPGRRKFWNGERNQPREPA